VSGEARRQALSTLRLTRTTRRLVRSADPLPAARERSALGTNGLSIAVGQLYDDAMAAARSTSDTGYPLPGSRAALAQARRVLDQLPAKESSVEAYRDYIPWVLDRLDNVWRTINSESEGKRTGRFANWWSGQVTDTREAIRVLRNAEVKRNEQSTRRTRVGMSPTRLQVHEDGTISLHRADGTVSRITPGGPVVLEPPQEWTATWDFAVPGLADQPVEDVLELVYSQLADSVLPTAEQLL
jgi:hypothetical protein